jgi:hypothetical protein
MKIVLPGLTSDDVGTSAREMQVMFGDALQIAVADISIAAGIETIFITPVVVRPGVGPFPDKLAYLRSEPAVNVSINVAYEKWVHGTRSDHVDLVAAAVTDGITRIKESKLSSSEKAAILECVEKARRLLLEQNPHAGPHRPQM